MARKKVENHSKSSESPWKVGNSKKRGQGVYYNRVTGQSRWCKPDSGILSLVTPLKTGKLGILLVARYRSKEVRSCAGTNLLAGEPAHAPLC